MGDKDGDGTLDIDELRRGISEIGADQLPSDLDEMLNSLDQDGTGSIDYNEFLALMLDRQDFLEEDICRAAFRVFDVTGDGRITLEEMKMVLSNPIMDTDNSIDFEQLMAEVDINGDGEIDFDEFMQMMRKSGHRPKTAKTPKSPKKLGGELSQSSPTEDMVVERENIRAQTEPSFQY